jgi:uncharacterized membrane protein YcaP (DUF421 family)
VLIEQGEINKRALAKEMMSVSELATVAHRQGLESLDQVDRCVLEPGGTFHMVRKDQDAKGGEAQILIRLQRILTELRRLEKIMAKGNG